MFFLCTAKEVYREKRRRPKAPKANPYDVVLATDAIATESNISEVISSLCKCAETSVPQSYRPHRDMTVAKRIIARQLGVSLPSSH